MRDDAVLRHALPLGRGLGRGWRAVRAENTHCGWECGWWGKAVEVTVAAFVL